MLLTSIGSCEILGGVRTFLDFTLSVFIPLLVFLTRLLSDLEEFTDEGDDTDEYVDTVVTVEAGDGSSLLVFLIDLDLELFKDEDNFLDDDADVSLLDALDDRLRAKEELLELVGLSVWGVPDFFVSILDEPRPWGDPLFDDDRVGVPQVELRRADLLREVVEEPPRVETDLWAEDEDLWRLGVVDEDLARLDDPDLWEEDEDLSRLGVVDEDLARLDDPDLWEEDEDLSRLGVVDEDLVRLGDDFKEREAFFFVSVFFFVSFAFDDFAMIVDYAKCTLKNLW